MTASFRAKRLPAAALLLAAAGCAPVSPTARAELTPEERAASQRQEDLARAVGKANRARWDAWLAEPPQAALRQTLLEHEQLLPDSSNYQPAPRFVQALALSDQPTLRRSRDQLLSDIRQRLAERNHVRRDPSSPGAPDDSPETLSAAQAKLTHGDLLTIQLLLTFLATPQIQSHLLQLGAADRADTTTEHGGALAASGNHLTLQLISPMYTGNDLAYITSDRAMALVPASIALFHLHFHRQDNAENAGPGAGDLAFAHINGVNCVVFTSLDAHSFDADYYNPDGAVVDLGVYHGD